MLYTFKGDLIAQGKSLELKLRSEDLLLVDPVHPWELAFSFIFINSFALIKGEKSSKSFP